MNEVVSSLVSPLDEDDCTRREVGMIVGAPARQGEKNDRFGEIKVEFPCGLRK